MAYLHDSKNPSLREPVPVNLSPMSACGRLINEYYKLREYDEYDPIDEKLELLDLGEFKGMIPRK